MAETPDIEPALVVDGDRDSDVATQPVVGNAAHDPVLTDNGADSEPMQHPLVRDLMLNPTRWRLWPALAVLRWLQQRIGSNPPRLVFRGRASLSFATSEVSDLVIGESRFDLSLNAPGLATAGSPLPASDVSRIIEDHRAGGALSEWLDGPTDRLMHALESMQAQVDPAFALMTGGQVEALMMVSNIVGDSVPLGAGPGGDLYLPEGHEPLGAVGLAGLFLGPVSAAGLEGVFRAFTGLPVRIEEFTGATIPTARPARTGGPFGRMLGAQCRLPSAGVEIHMEGGARPEAQDWARSPIRRGSLWLLALSYIGSPTPEATLFLWLDGDNAPPAALDGATALGGLAVLGPTDEPVRLPLGRA